MKERVPGWLFVLCFWLAACKSQPEAVSVTRMIIATFTMKAQVTIFSTPIPSTSSLTATETPFTTVTSTLLPTHQPTRTPSLESIQKPTATATIFASPLPLMLPPAGLVYKTDNAIWRVDKSGVPVKITDAGKSDWFWLFSDNQKIMLVSETQSFPGFTTNDYLIIDLSDGTKTHLTPPEGYHFCDVKETGKQGWLLAVLMPDDKIVNGLNCQGAPAMVSLDGKISFLSSKEKIEDSLGLGVPGSSPDGELIAFDLSGTPWIYHWGIGSKLFDLTQYNFSVVTDTTFMNPAWSPTGNYIAWVATSSVRGFKMPDGVAIFNLKDHSSHLVRVSGIGDPLSLERAYMTWSLDEKYLALYNTYQGGSWADEWCIGVDGIQINCPQIPDRTWSPDKKWYASAIYNNVDESKFPVQKSIIVTSADGSEVHEFMRMGDPLWSPDSRWLIVSNRYSPDNQSTTWIIEIGIWQVYQLDLPLDAIVKDWLPAQEP